MRLYPLRIVGQPLVGGPEIEERRTSAADGSNEAFFTDAAEPAPAPCAAMPTCRHGRMRRRWREFLLDRCEFPRLTAYAGGCAGTPAARLGDRVTVTDTPTMSSTFTGYVTAINWTMDKDGFRQDWRISGVAVVPERQQLFCAGDAHVLQQQVPFLLMALIDVFPPSWSSGELLSAAKLNQLSDVVNGLKVRPWRRRGFLRARGNGDLSMRGATGVTWRSISRRAARAAQRRPDQQHHGLCLARSSRRARRRRSTSMR